MTKSQVRSPEPLLDIPAVAGICNVSEKTIRRWIKAGEMRAARLGNQWRIRPRDLEDFVRGRLTR